MATIAYNESITLHTETCITCGIIFAVPKGFQDQRRQDHKSFCCPNGHEQQYSSKSEAEKVRDELKRKEQELADEVRRRIAAQNEIASKDKQLKRLTNGVCPCCNRSFHNLQQHMKKQHPEAVVPTQKKKP